MNAPFNTPQALATELLRVDQLRRLRETTARAEALKLWRPLSERRLLLEIASNHLDAANNHGARCDTLLEGVDLLLADLQHEIDETLRHVAIRHRLFADDDATEDFDDVDIDAVLPVEEAVRRRVNSSTGRYN